MTFLLQTSRTNRGSKVFTAVAAALVMAVVGGGYVFWSDRPGLLRHLRDRDDLAVASVWVMIKQGVDASKARQPLLDALEKGEPSLRSASATALGTLRDEDTVAELGKAATRDASPAVRLAAVEALEVIGATSAQPYVRLALDDPDLVVEGAACRTVGGLGLRELVVLVIEKLGSPDAKLRLAAQAGLERFLRPGETTRGADPGPWSSYFSTR